MLVISPTPPRMYSCLCPRQDYTAIGFGVGGFRLFAFFFFSSQGGACNVKDYSCNMHLAR